jgi:hypothetical protein
VKTSLWALLALVAAASCGGDDGAAPAMISADYVDTFTEVRDCRRSIDHDLEFVRILADADALAPYRDRDAAFPVGSIIVKEQYLDNDDDCSGEIVRYTAMRKLEDGADPDFLDWEWEGVDLDFGVVEDEDPIGCASCHESCEEPEGYLNTCSAPDL